MVGGREAESCKGVGRSCSEGCGAGHVGGLGGCRDVIEKGGGDCDVLGGGWVTGILEGEGVAAGCGCAIKIRVCEDLVIKTLGSIGISDGALAVADCGGEKAGEVCEGVSAPCGELYL